MKVYIMRGLPGSGKTSWINRYLPGNTNVFSADFYHMTEEGVYQFDPKRASHAHNECLRSYDICLMLEMEHHALLPVAVDNTNILAWELAPYVRLAEIRGFEYEILHFLCDPETSIKRNIHTVPATTILRMHQDLLREELPPWWKVQVVPSDWKIISEKS